MRFRNKILVRSFGVILLSLMMFTLSSKSKCKEPECFNDGGNNICDNISDSEVDLDIVIAFDAAATSNGYLGRNNNYEFHIPQNDIRFGSDPASSLTDGTSYYSLITVTSPQCSSYSRSGRITSSNGADGRVAIKVPDKDIEIKIKVEYYEACANGVWAENGKRLLYSKEKTYSTSPAGFPSEAFFLIPESIVNCSSGSGTSNKRVDLLLDELDDMP